MTTLGITYKPPTTLLERTKKIMKKQDNYRRAVQRLNNIFNLANADYFNNELPETTVTIQESQRAYGHCSISKVWKTEDGRASREINISALYLNRPIEDVVTTLLHEMAHLYNLEHGIKDCSGSSLAYHNKAFKLTAEQKCHLTVEHDTRYGWTITKPTEETIDFCIRHEITDFLINRDGAYSFGGFTGGTSSSGNPIKPIRRPSSTRKYICPCCGNSFRATKNLDVLCMDCNEQFVIAS